MAHQNMILTILKAVWILHFNLFPTYFLVSLTFVIKLYLPTVLLHYVCSDRGCMDQFLLLLDFDNRVLTSLMTLVHQL